MENRANSTRPNLGNGGGLRRPLRDLTSNSNNRPQAPTHQGLKQGFSIFQDSRINDENQPPPRPPKAKTIWPAPPPIPTASFSRPMASSSPASSLVSTNVVVDPFSLYSSTSAAEFRSNNDSISSVTTNEDLEDCDDDLDLDVIHPKGEADEAAPNGEAEFDLSYLVDEAVNAEYAVDILKGMIEREVNYLPKWNYMTKQPDITFTMRSILVDWLVEVGEEYKLHTETLFLAVNYIDRFLSLMSVQRAKLQLVGTACMFIAAKYEEVYPPDVTEFCYITDGTYSKRQVLRMEQLVLGVLNFEAAPPTAHFFVNHISGLAGCGPKATALAQYLTELTLIDGEAFMAFSPSVVASAAVALARHTLGYAAWEDDMEAKTGYHVDDFKECLIRLHETFEAAPEMGQQAVREKYKNAKFFSVSDVKPTPIF